MTRKKQRCTGIFTLFIFFMLSTILVVSSIQAGGFYPQNADAYIHKSPQAPVPGKGANLSAATMVIRMYQLLISPQDGPTCRFKPTCSRYAATAIKRHGFFSGIFMAADRLTRDNPFNPGVEDQVP